MLATAGGALTLALVGLASDSASTITAPPVPQPIAAPPAATTTSAPPTPIPTTALGAPRIGQAAGPTAETTPTTSPAAPIPPIPPPDLLPLAGAALPGEGHWAPAGRLVGGHPALWTTMLRPASGGDPVGIARMDMTLLTVVPFAGTTQPGGSWTNQALVTPDRQQKLVAAFNGGFMFAASGGGFYADGRAAPDLQDGAASLLVNSHGAAQVGQWGRDVTLAPSVLAVRQNLRLLVDAGAPTAAASAPGLWGATFGNVSSTWRSAVGSDDDANLYYVGGPGLSPADLAGVMVAAGAQRAMEFDINPQWVIFDSYADGPGTPPATVGTKLLESMNYGADHFLAAESRDFVAVFARPTSPAG